MKTNWKEDKIGLKIDEEQTNKEKRIPRDFRWVLLKIDLPVWLHFIYWIIYIAHTVIHSFILLLVDDYRPLSTQGKTRRIWLLD